MNISLISSLSIRILHLLSNLELLQKLIEDDSILKCMQLSVLAVRNIFTSYLLNRRLFASDCFRVLKCTTPVLLKQYNLLHGPAQLI